MLTISRLGKKFNISRSTILYYERAGLLLPSKRSANGYRWYNSEQVEILELILAYRSLGLPIAKIADLLRQKDQLVQEQILSEQFLALEREIQKLRLQQRAITTLLGSVETLHGKILNKEQWSQIMKAAGLTERDMKRWHAQFEKMEPESHQAFLESLHISPDEIAKIRSWSDLGNN